MVKANVETRRDEYTFLGSGCNIYEHIFYERRLDHESILSRSGLWAKILGEEPLFSCMGLSFEERFGNVANMNRTSSRGSRERQEIAIPKRPIPRYFVQDELVLYKPATQKAISIAPPA